jgi:hypothetical protein
MRLPGENVDPLTGLQEIRVFWLSTGSKASGSEYSTESKRKDIFVINRIRY